MLVTEHGFYQSEFRSNMAELQAGTLNQPEPAKIRFVSIRNKMLKAVKSHL